jgi:hypothetical protein
MSKKDLTANSHYLQMQERDLVQNMREEWLTTISPQETEENQLKRAHASGVEMIWRYCRQIAPYVSIYFGRHDLYQSLSLVPQKYNLENKREPTKFENLWAEIYSNAENLNFNKMSGLEKKLIILKLMRVIWNEERNKYYLMMKINEQENTNNYYPYSRQISFLEKIINMIKNPPPKQSGNRRNRD